MEQLKKNRWGAVLLTATSLQLAEMPVADAIPRNDLSPVELPDWPGGHRKLRPEDLPGNRLKLRASTLQKLAASALNVLTLDGTNKAELCTGTKLANNDVSIAAHCVSYITGDDYGNISPTQFSNATRAANFISQAPKEVTVTAALSDPMTSPALAKANGISISLNHKDIGRLRVTPNGSDYAKIPGFRAAPRTRQYRPIPGQRVGMYGISAKTSGPVSGTGVYIGSSIDTYYRPIELVGINSQTAETDTCYFRQSGVSFTATVKGKDYLSGPLSMRYNRTYDIEHATQQKKDEIKEFWHLQSDYTGVWLGQFTTLCAYAKVGSQEVRDLQQGYNYPAIKAAR